MSDTETQPSTEAPAETTLTTEAAATEAPADIATSYADGKYTSVGELEKGYTHLQGRFGAFTGSPEAYELAEGIESTPRLEALQEWGRENQLNNDALNAIVQLDTDATQKAQESYVSEQKQILGKDADVRINNLSDWVIAQGGDQDTFAAMMGSAKSVELMEQIMKGSQGVTPAATPAAKVYDRDSLNAMRFEKTASGDRRMSVDPEFRKRVEGLEREAHGRG